MLGLSSSNGTSTVSLTSVSDRLSTALFTIVLTSGIVGWVMATGTAREATGSGRTQEPGVSRENWDESGRGDSNSRSPAPKAGALATTLRPAARGQCRRTRSVAPLAPGRVRRLVT